MSSKNNTSKRKQSYTSNNTSRVNFGSVYTESNNFKSRSNPNRNNTTVSPTKPDGEVPGKRKVGKWVNVR